MVSTVERWSKVARWSVALTVKLQAGSAKKSTCDYVSRRMRVERFQGWRGSTACGRRVGGIVDSGEEVTDFRAEEQKSDFKAEEQR